jgi:hypothetical protein
MDGARVTLRTDAELERTPGDAKRAVGVSHAESWRRNIYASKPAHYTFLQWNQVYTFFRSLTALPFSSKSGLRSSTWYQSIISMLSTLREDTFSPINLWAHF